MNEKHYIIADIGNSYTKIAVFNSKKIILEKYEISNKNIETNIFRKIAKKIKEKFLNIEHFFLGSVRPPIRDIIKKIFLNVLNLNAYEIQKNTKFSFDILGDDPTKIGNDILGFCQFINSISSNSVGFSFGTANVAIHLENKRLKGVVIAAGLENSFKSLINSAWLLNEKDTNLKSTTKIGTDTTSALESGIYHQRNGFILSFLSHLKNENPSSSFKVIVTGGTSLDIYEEQNFIVEKNAILLGYLDILFINKM